MPERHPVALADVDPGRLHKVLLRTYERPPEDFASLLGTAGLGPKSLRALALTAEVIYGTKASTRDPARFAFAHGGKDGTPYPVDRATYDVTIEVLHDALGRAKVDRSERIAALKRLAAFARAARVPRPEPRRSMQARAQRRRWRLALNVAVAPMLHSRVAAREARHDHAALHAPILARARHRARPSGVDRAHPRDHGRPGARGAQGRARRRRAARAAAGDPRAAGARAHGALRRRRAARRAGLGTRAPRPRHRDVAGLGRGGAARRGRRRSPRSTR